MKKHYLPLVFFLTYSFSVFSQVWSPKAQGELPNNYNVSDISIVSEQVIWAVAIDYSQNISPVPATHVIKLLKSTDGGDTWAANDIEEVMGRVSYDIHAFDENTACITTQDLDSADGRGIFRTTDGGENWAEVLSGNAGGVWLHFFDDQEGTCINRQAMGRTTDGGAIWELVPTDNIPDFQEGEFTISFSSSSSLASFGNSLWFGTVKGRIFKSGDRGQTWGAFETGLGDNSNLHSIAFIDENNGLGIYGTTLARTTDGGESWESLGSVDFEEVIAVPCTNTFMGVAYFYDLVTSISIDHGETWTAQESPIGAFAPTFVTPELGWISNGGPLANGSPLYKWVGGPLNGRIYVKQDAIGANNGSSWVDAFNDLNEALANAEVGDEIWVAEGTYLPGSDPTSTFLVDQDLKLYGGFVGTENNLSERDIELHPTILSGDVNGDDVEGDFETNRGDNVMTVVTVDENVTGGSILDGFVIEGGHSNGSGGPLSASESGGGLFSEGALTIEGCLFRQNFAKLLGGGAFLNNSESLQLEVGSCRFEDNQAARGGGLNVNDSNCQIAGCSFENNLAPQHGGGLRFSSFKNDKTAEVINCKFMGGKSSFGGGLFLESVANNTSFLISDCEFIENESLPLEPEWGQSGGGCTLTLFPGTMDNNVLVRNCIFSQNSSTMEAGGLGIFGGGKSVCEIDSCRFEGNSATYNAALIMGSDIPGSENEFIVNQCVIVSNEAVEGGPLQLWNAENATVNFYIFDCLIENNLTLNQGSGISFAPHDSAFYAVVENSRIEKNISPLGSAIEVAHFFPVDDLAAAFISIENCLIAENEGEDAAVFIEEIPWFEFLNTTIADNAGGGVSFSSQGDLFLQNTVFNNPGGIELIDNTVNGNIISLGGNLVLDNSMNEYLIALDKPETAPGFMPGTYEPSATSPLVNAGVNDGVTAEFDLAGNLRIQQGKVDIGAYESPFDDPTSAREVISGKLMVSPNPASDFVQIDLPNGISGKMALDLFDPKGRLVERHIVSGRGALQVGHLASGVYSLRMVDGEQVYVGKFVKQ